ncbi:hypothetical protein PR202_gb28152 [Eleusine coracana subsp. coracana]|uniref:B box-type domain-containing protein n=1 Tax=Eleusine coracana subsp. coracana TaxID=191504 RepID=A0AAV5FTK1_ELECO|nr:hypothetical protein PR202_gb28152 [Eleusine coracana subsp. coracana]
MGMRPGWVGGLVEESFFVGCEAHENYKKNEKNIFCLCCCTSICTHCAPAHRRHPLIQVRRYVYHDVVRLDDLERLIDCSFVQSYTINGAKVIFLKQRPQSRPFKGSGNVCLTCARILQEPFHFCCLSCKGGDLSNILYAPGGGVPDLGCGFENLRFEDDAAGQVTPNSILEDPNATGGGSSTAGSRNNVVVPARKKKSSSGFFPQLVLSLGGNRRKGAPHRAPLS